MRIRFIVSSTIQSRDRNGNVYSYSIITATATGDHLEVDNGWGSDDSNTMAALRRAGIEWSEIYTARRTVGIRDFRRLKEVIPSFVQPGNVTAAMLADLERAS